MFLVLMPSIKGMFALVPEELPSTMRQLPHCTDIVELPYSMSAMDHLVTIADRRILNESKQETALKRVCGQGIVNSFSPVCTV